MRSPLRALAVAALSLGALVGCGNDDDQAVSAASDSTAVAESTVTESTETRPSLADDTLPDDTLPPDTTPVEDSAPETTAPETTAPEGTVPPTTDVEDTAPVASLPGDSPTCQALTVVQDLNQENESLAKDFQAKILEVVQKTIAGDSGEDGTRAIEAEFDKFLAEFNSKTDTMLPKLQDAYERLSEAQPQFADDLELIERVSVALLKAFGNMKGSDLERFEDVISEAAPTADLIGAGAASLKIDKFARAACGVGFANT